MGLLSVWLVLAGYSGPVALPGELVGALRPLLILARLSHYLTFAVTGRPAVFQLRVVF